MGWIRSNPIAKKPTIKATAQRFSSTWLIQRDSHLLAPAQSVARWINADSLGSPLIFFAISRAGFKSYRELGTIDSPLWICAGLLTDDEPEELRAEGVDVSDFNYTLDPRDWAGIEDALGTIREHHPGHTVWVGI